jgi:hypothetical protein
MTKLSRKALMPYIEEITPIVGNLRIAVEKIPESTKLKSLLLSLVNLEKKIAVSASTRELTEEKVLEYLNTHPEVKAKLAGSDSAIEALPPQERKKKRF